MGALVEINTDGLAKLAETISFALGGTARGERKMADAKAYAAELEAKTKNEVALIEAQGQDALANYVAAKEARKMRNTVAVIEKAQAHFIEGEKVSNEPVDEGWKNRFFGIVEEISDDELREIWGRVLAGEVKQPKSYSLRTLDVLRNMTKEEAALVVKAAPFVMKNECVYKDCSLSLKEKLALQEIGIMLEEGLGLQYKWNVKAHSEHIEVINTNDVVCLRNDSDKEILCAPNVYKLSTAGREIFNLVNIDYNNRRLLYEQLADAFKKEGLSHFSVHKIVGLSKTEASYEIKGEDFL